MIITNVIKDSFIDYKGEQALVVFTQGCNLNCDVCYNKNVKPQFENNIFQVLEEHLTPMHTALVISGGEPTLQDLKDTCKSIKERHPKLKIKVFTNGQRPEVVRESIPYVDAWSVDFKTINSDKILGGHYPLYRSNVLKTLEILVQEDAECMVRIWKVLNSEEDVDRMIRNINSYSKEIPYEFVDILL